MISPTALQGPTQLTKLMLRPKSVSLHDTSLYSYPLSNSLSALPSKSLESNCFAPSPQLPTWPRLSYSLFWIICPHCPPCCLEPTLGTLFPHSLCVCGPLSLECTPSGPCSYVTSSQEAFPDHYSTAVLTPT